MRRKLSSAGKDKSKPGQKNKHLASSQDLPPEDELDYEEDEVLDDTSDPESLDDPESEEYEEDEDMPKSKKILIGVGAVVVVILAIVVFSLLHKSSSIQTVGLPPTKSPTSSTGSGGVNALQQQKDALYKSGIGKNYITDQNVYDQGPIESNTFRKDFLNSDSPEMYKKPVKIVGVQDSVSYKKHRTVTDDGMDMYWVEATYKGKKTEFTIPYYIYQTLTAEGVMNVTVETVTDADGKVYVASMTALPPSKGN